MRDWSGSSPSDGQFSGTNYDLVYTAPLAPGDLKGSVLDNLEYRFNNEHPADYRHPSMSVSDIVAIKRDGKISCPLLRQLRLCAGSRIPAGQSIEKCGNDRGG